MSEQIEIGTAVMQAAQVQASGPGSRGWVRFLVHSHDAARMIDEAMGEQAFTVQFDKVRIGVGLTVSSIAAKRDAEGVPTSGLTFAVPESAVRELSKAIGAMLIGKQGKVLLEPDQLELDLTTKAE